MCTQSPIPDGPALHSLLTSLNCPPLTRFTPSSLDWLADSPSRLPFLKWLISSLSQDHVVSSEELDLFATLAPDKILSGPLLTSAIASCGLGEADLTEAELEVQVRELEVELGLQEDCRDKLEHLEDKIGSQVVREQAAAGQVDHLLEMADRDERRRQEQVLLLNDTWNSVVDQLTKAVVRVADLHKEGVDQRQVFLCRLKVGKLQAAEDRLDKELQGLIARQFGEVEVEEETTPSFVSLESPACLNLVKGRGRQEFSSLVSEINRLRVSFYQAEMERLLLLAEEAGLKAVLARSSSGREKEVRLAKPVIREPGDQIGRLEAELAGLVAKVAGGHCQHILTQDYREKVARGKVVVERLERVRDLLVEKVARAEVLNVLLGEERRRVEGLKELFTMILEDFRLEAKKIENFRTAMKSLKSSQTSDPTLITANDPVMLRTWQCLSTWDLVPPHLVTYSGVREAVVKLEATKARLLDDKREARAKKEMALSELERGVRQLLRTLHIQTASPMSTSVSLAPRVVTDRLNSLDTSIRELERVVKRQMEAWEKDKKEVKNNPHLRLQRDVWVDFLVKPQVLAANLRSHANNL